MSRHGLLGSLFNPFILRRKELWRDEPQLTGNSNDKYLSIFLKPNGGSLLWFLSFKYFSQHVATSLSIWTFRLRTGYRQKRLECMLISDTALSTSRFISPSVTKANRSPILTLILIVNKTRLEVFEIGEYHLWNIIGYSPVLAGVYSVTWGV